MKREQCPRCADRGLDKSRDNLVIYRDGSGHCFACNYDTRKGKPKPPEEMEGMLSLKDVSQLPVLPLTLRGISKETAQRYGVRAEVDMETGKPSAFYYPLFRDNNLVGYQRKVARAPGQRQKKDVFRLGHTEGCEPFGSKLAGAGGKFVIVTEGGEDCLAASQMLKDEGKNYRVVATLGTNGWQDKLSWFDQYEVVAIAFDQDEQGQQAAREFAAALSPGKARLVRWEGGDDPNSLLSRQDGSQRFVEALRTASRYAPEGIITGEEVWERMKGYVRPHTIPYPEEWEQLAAKMGGMRAGEISLWTGGTSVGKTSYIRRLKQHVLTTTDEIIGEVELEERSEKTWRGLMQFQAHKHWSEMSEKEKRRAYEATYGTERIHTLDHRSQFNRGQSLVSKFKHLHYGMGASIIFLDHITLAVSEFGDGSGITAQDQMMNEFLEFVESTNAHLAVISHLRKVPGGGKSFEEGAIPTEDDLKGSGSIKQIAADTIGISRNKMDPDPYQRNVSQLHVLKCRETGDTGPADRLYWDGENQDLVPAEEEYENESDE